MTEKTPLTPAEAAQEILARDDAYASLERFIEYTEQLKEGQKPAAHHRLLIKHLEAVERGDIQRLMVLMPPGSAKSTYTSILFPPWFMGRNPYANLIGVSNTTALAEKWSRHVRAIVALPRFRNVFGCSVRPDVQAASNWETERGGEYFAAGMGTAIAGRRADLSLIDDPVASREDADSELLREKQWDWYNHDLSTRLKPGGRQILIQCMTGDTRVLMADGSESALRDVLVGDKIATYENGRLSTSTVLNWVNQGSDDVYEIRTKSEGVARANRRHPFLTDRDGVLAWVRLQDLRAGDRLVRAIGANGEALPAPSRVAAPRRDPKGIATRITTRLAGLADIGRRLLIRSLDAMRSCVTDTASAWLNTMRCLPSKMGNAPFAGNLQGKMCALTGAASSASITITSRDVRADFSATTAILPSAMQRPRKSCLRPLDTYEIGRDEITEIVYVGREDVFDIQVARTENFIADGLVSHNTRWHEDDLGGRILEREANRWTVVKIPMVSTGADDPLGRELGQRLWPEWFTEEMVDQARRDARVWNALYQQDPAPEDGDYFRREHFQDYDQPPEGLRIYGASDYAVSEGRGDYTEHGIFGFDFSGCIYILDWWRGQTAPDKWIEAQCNLIAKWRPVKWFGESGVIRKAVEPFLKRRMIERQTECYLEWLPSIADKPTRARAFQAKAWGENVFLPRKAPWRSDLMGQLMRFPAGKYDDGVDVCSLIGRALESARPPEPQNPKPRNSTGGRINHRSDGWMLN